MHNNINEFDGGFKAKVIRKFIWFRCVFYCTYSIKPDECMQWFVFSSLGVKILNWEIINKLMNK